MLVRILEWLDGSLNPLLAKLTGFRVVRDFPKLDDVRNSILNKLEIGIAIDGGANQGQWAKRLRNSFPLIQINSFEPVSSQYQILYDNSKSDHNWNVFNEALGSVEGSANINLASNDSMSASLRNPTQHLQAHPTVTFRGTEKISIKRLDSFDFGKKEDLLFLKLDVQGFEIDALLGSEKILNNVAMIEVETSYRQMYEGEMNHTNLVSWLESRGFEVFTISQPSFDRNGRVGYLDCLLVNSKFIDKIS
jgi:FkbM family methyltransferase